MHHGKHFRRLNRTSSHRNALLRNLASSLIEFGRIETTVAKAKELKPIADSMITLGKKGNVEAKRQAIAYLYSPTVTVPKLFDELAPRFAQRNGGYTRIQRIGNRYGDNAPMAVIEYIDGPNDIKKSMVTQTLARVLAESNQTSKVKAAFEGSADLGLSKTLLRDLKKVQFANSIENLSKDVEKEITKHY
ncbi:ribosomal protein L17 [Phycomyces nitens]|nr:ribosomal protein L17 [Phycomyces nitens]